MTTKQLVKKRYNNSSVLRRRALKIYIKKQEQPKQQQLKKTNKFMQFITLIFDKPAAGLVGTATLGATGSALPLTNIDPAILGYAQFGMYVLACIVSLITIVGWIKKTFFKKK